MSPLSSAEDFIGSPLHFLLVGECCNLLLQALSTLSSVLDLNYGAQFLCLLR